MREPLALADGTTVTALEVQWELLTRARKYADEVGLEPVGEQVGAEVLRRWEAVLTGLEADPMRLADQRRLGGQVPPDRRLPRAPRPGLG